LYSAADIANSKFTIQYGLFTTSGDAEIAQYGSGNIKVNGSVEMTTGFLKMPTYTAANLTAVTGQVGWTAAVTNSAGGGNPDGMLAFWDTTNSRWSYIHDNSAV
jgi:hypothetical protein